MSQWIVAEVVSGRVGEADLLSLLSCSGEVLQCRFLSEEGSTPSSSSPRIWAVQFTPETGMDYVRSLNNSRLGGSPLTLRPLSNAEVRVVVGDGSSPGVLSLMVSAVWSGATKAIGMVVPSTKANDADDTPPPLGQVGGGSQPQWGHVVNR